MRFITLLLLLLALGVVFIPTGAALDYNDESEEAPRGEVGMLYHFELHSHSGCDNAPYRYVIESGSLPPGLKLTPESYDLPNKVHTGLIDGMPTEGGTWSAWIALKDICGNSAELLFTFEIWPRRFTIANDKLPAGAASSPYSATLTVSGVRSNVTWKVTNGSLPSGLTLNSDGTITGTPTAVGSSTFTVTATGVSTDPSADGTRIDSKQFTISVTQPLGVSVSRRIAEVGVPFRGALVGNGGQSPYTWAATGLPAGLAVDASGSISGTPAQAGSFPVHVTLTDANGTPKAVDVTLRIVPHLTITTKKVHVSVDRTSNAAVGYRGGRAPVRFTIVRGHLLPGLKLERRTGRIVGVTHAAGSARIVVRGNDSLGAVATKTIVITAG